MVLSQTGRKRAEVSVIGLAAPGAVLFSRAGGRIDKNESRPDHDYTE